MIVKKAIIYQDKDITLKGMVAFDDAMKTKRPLVLIAPDWSGCNDFAKNKAETLAQLGYVGFAIDMYGDGNVFKTKEEKSAAIQPLVENRKLLIERIQAAFSTAKNLEMVDPQKIAAMGFCFGGLCVLDLARSGAPVKGVVSFHGLLMPLPFAHPTIQAKVLALHGHDDPMVPPDAVLAFEKEMTAAKVDWQFHVFGNTMHAFTNPEANDPGFGTVYNHESDYRSSLLMKNFFEEIFS